MSSQIESSLLPETQKQAACEIERAVAPELGKRAPRTEAWLRTGGVVAAAAAFAWWFNSRQLAAVSPEYRANVPLSAQIPTLVSTFLVVLCLYGAVRLTAGAAGPFRFSGRRITLRAALFVASIVIAIIFKPIEGVIALIVGLAATCGGEFFRSATRDDYRYWRDEYLIPFTVIFAAHWFLLSSLSPAYLAQAVTRSATTYLADSSTAMADYVNSFSFSFSNFYHGFWGAAENVPTGLSSFVLGIFGFLHLFPLWEASSFFKSLTLAFFAMFVVASFFFYLFMREAGISRAIACGAGAIYVLGNGFFLRAAALEDGSWYVTEYVVLPIALFAVARAFRSGSFIAAGWAGLALAAQFYLMAPHPEATIYSVVLFAILSIAFVLLKNRRGFCGRGKAVAICAVSGATFTLGAAAYLALIVYLEFSGTFDIVGNTIAVKSDYILPIPGFCFAVVGIGTAVEFYRELRYRRPNWVALGFLTIAGVSLLFGVQGTARALMALTQHGFGWSIHLFPPDRFLTWLGLSMIVIAAFGIDACFVWFRRSRRWQGCLSQGGPVRMMWLDALASVVAFLSLCALFVVPSNSAREHMIMNAASRRPYESIEAALANSLAPADRAASAGYLRARLIAFERALARNPAAFPAAREQYRLALRQAAVPSARALAPGQVRSFAGKVAGAIDRGYLAEPNREDIPQNIDAYLSTLDDPYARVMSILDLSHQTVFLGAARNVTDAQNNTMMFDTRMTVGYPLIEGLFMYPLSQLGTFQHMVNMAADYAISSRRYSWLYFASDVFGHPDFRRLLNIAGVQAYLTLPKAEVENAVAEKGSGLHLLPPPSSTGQPKYLLVKDERADDIAYLARVVKLENTAAASAAVAATHAYYRFHITEDAYRAALDPLLSDLLHLARKGDAIIGFPGWRGRAPAAIAESDARAMPRGHVEIDNIVGPRTGLTATCLEASCWLVYNMADLPGWKAYVDGRAAPIARANYAFLAVEVQNGRHYVAFLYAPDIDTAAAVVSLLALLIMLELTWRRSRRGGAA